MRKSKENIAIPTTEQLEAEKRRLNKNKNFRKTVITTFNILLVVAAVAVLIATLFLPIIQISGDSMEPTLNDREIIVMQKTNRFSTGDLVALNYSGKVLIKRVIARAGDFVDIDNDGNVYVNNTLIDEPYVVEKCLGDVSITLPYQVPDDCVFVLGDHRSVSVDSRNSDIGCIRYEDIIGKAGLRVWPITDFGIVK